MYHLLKRYLPVALFIIFAVYLLSSSASRFRTASGGKVSQQQNKAARPYAPSGLNAIPSSFNWSAITFQHLPGTSITLPAGKPHRFPPVQSSFPNPSAEYVAQQDQRLTQIRDAFRKCWTSYKKFAWLKDELLPLGKKGRDNFGGWSATLVDSLDTLWIMGLHDEFREAVAAAASIDFGHFGAVKVNMFETNIRLLGGFLAAYDLSQEKALLTKAVELGDLLYAGFNTPNRMPVNGIDFHQAKSGDGLLVEGSVVSASPGTLSLEFTRLSQITGDPKYYDAIAAITKIFRDSQNSTRLPGMWPQTVSMTSFDFKFDSIYTLGSGADSLYEYLPKMHALLGGLDPDYEKMTTYFLDTADQKLLFRPLVPKDDDILVAGKITMLPPGTIGKDYDFTPEGEHLTCFIGGVYGLAGRLLGNEYHVDLGLKLAQGCAYAYTSFPSGIMPERYTMAQCESRTSCSWDEVRWEAEKAKRPGWQEAMPKGFTTSPDSRYLLRPEAIESVFLMYRITGREELREAAWVMWEAVQQATSTEHANAAVLDVTKPKGSTETEDYMESFWLAETLKYFYLTFAPPSLISLDDYVLNTEAHPFKRPT